MNYHTPVSHLGSVPIIREEDLDILRDRLDFRGLSAKQRRFIFSFNGNYQQAAKDAGYKNAHLGGTVAGLMRNDKVRRNIKLIQKALEEYGIGSLLEAKLIITDIARNSSDEGRRMAAAKLILQWEGGLTERLLVENKSIGTVQHNTQIVFNGLPAPSGPMAALALETIQPSALELSVPSVDDLI